MSNTREIHNLDEMKIFAEEVLKNLKTNVLCLEGDLGSGKTTFTQQVASIFNIKENVTSPTFILQKKYNIVSNPWANLSQISQIIHMDMYRIEDVNELKNLGFEQLLKDPKNLLIIEWPEKVQSAIPPNSDKISFQFVDETTRRVQW